MPFSPRKNLRLITLVALGILGLLVYSTYVFTQPIYASIIPTLILIAAVCGMVGILPRPKFPPKQLAIYLTIHAFSILLALHFWGRTSDRVIFPSLPHLPGDILLTIGMGIFTILWPFIVSLRFLQRRIVEVTVILIVLITVEVLAVEIFFRWPYSQRNILGAHPNGAYSVTNLPRQHMGTLDMEQIQPKPDGVLRILFIGDSYTWGGGLYPHERFAEVIGEISPEYIETVTLSKHGGSTHEQLAWWREYGIGVEADLVIVSVVSNDPDLKFNQQSDAILRPILTRLLPKSHFAYFLDSRNIGVEQPEEKLTYEEWQQAMFDSQLNQALWQIVVKQLYWEIRLAGAEAWAYIIPFSYPNERNLTYTARSFEVFQKAGFRTVDLQPAFDEFKGDREGSEFWVTVTDPHLNAEVNRWMAGVMWADINNLILDKSVVGGLE